MFKYKIQDLQVSNSQKKSSTSTILIALLVAGSLIAVLTIALSCGKKDVNTKENIKLSQPYIGKELEDPEVTPFNYHDDKYPPPPSPGRGPADNPSIDNLPVRIKWPDAHHHKKRNKRNIA